MPVTDHPIGRDDGFAQTSLDELIEEYADRHHRNPNRGLKITCSIGRLSDNCECMLYIAVVTLTMLILPIGSMGWEWALHPGVSLTWLAGKWFVFWGVGVRLALAGGRQVLQPEFTAREIFHMESTEALPLVRELGMANLATGVVGCLSLVAPGFVLPVAISAGIFYGVAGFRHVAERGRSANETVAMVSDLWLFAVLAAFVCTRAMTFF